MSKKKKSDIAYIICTPFDRDLSSIDYVTKYHNLLPYYKSLKKMINKNQDTVMYLYNLKDTYKISGKVFRMIFNLVCKLEREKYE
jgi:hypothetical protein